MKSVFEYFDYREFLKDFYEHRKSITPFFSFRHMSQKVDLHASHLIRIFNRQRHIAESSIAAFAKLCGLTVKEAAYFEALVAYNKSGSDKQAKIAFERLLAAASVQTHNLTAKQYELFQHWYYGAVRVLLSFFPFSGDYKDLAERMSPSITVHEAKRAIRLLGDLGFIQKTDDGIYVLTDRFITTGDEWKSIAVRTFQAQTIELAKESLERHDKNDRDISTVTIAIARSDLPLLKERIVEFRSSLLSMIKVDTQYDEVYQLNIQLFPLTDNRSRST